MTPHQPQLDWLDTQHPRVAYLLAQWANVNTGSYHVGGLNRMTSTLRQSFGPLGMLTELALPPQQVIDAAGRIVTAPLGHALLIRHQPKAPGKYPRVLLCIHMDTVYAADHPFQSTTMVGSDTLRGPGVADAKGGLLVMMLAVEAFRRSPCLEQLVYEILITPDEEIAAPGSVTLLQEAATRNDLGLLFEPALPDGALVGARKGSGNFTIIVHGKAAHVGRNFSDGASALRALAQLIVALETLDLAGVQVNFGRVEGGGPVNVVPDLAIGRFNVRVDTLEQQSAFEARWRSLLESFNAQPNVRVELHGSFSAPPKPVDAGTRRLLDMAASCGREIGLSVTWRDTGGVCDGNRLAAAGLANIDSLGPVGGNLHSPEEFVVLSSVVERAKLTTLMLMRIAGEGHGAPV